MATTTDPLRMQKLTGFVYLLIAAINLLARDYQQAAMWGSGAGCALITLGQQSCDLSGGRRWLYYFFWAAFIASVVWFVAGYFGLRFGS
jgi:arginine exporter protein ArgO